ncbi:MAG: pyruvate, phosphate dikinase, partial [Marinilabilia sp.]
AMGAPVEIEFVLDLEEPDQNGNPTLWLLQIKPLIRMENHVDVDFNEVDEERVILRSEKGMGNGLYNQIKDLIFMDVNKFDRTKTRNMGRELAELNKKMEMEGREYVLIAPGRMGTRDPSTGIPVYWSQISGARVIVEMGLPGFPLDASLGSHFFHNVTSMNVGYFSVHQKNTREFVDISYLEKQKVKEDTGYFKHIEFEKPLTVLMDGKNQKAVVMRGE